MVEQLCSDLDRKEPRYKSPTLLYFTYCVVGGRYTQDTYGLRIQNITTADDGTYYCRAEVDSWGNYGERAIDVIVHSKSE